MSNQDSLTDIDLSALIETFSRNPNALFSKEVVESLVELRSVRGQLSQARVQRYPHWSCKTHGDFDARVVVGCPECVRDLRTELAQAKERITSLEDACDFQYAVTRMTAEISAKRMLQLRNLINSWWPSEAPAQPSIESQLNTASPQSEPAQPPRSIQERIAELELDPVKKAALDQARERRKQPREAPFLPFTHWSKDPLIPYAGCACSSCEEAAMYFRIETGEDE